jgi:short-subunit dehydrogenase
MTPAHCILIGAGDGLGQSLARKFAKEGFNLSLVSRSEKGSAAG